MSEQMDSAVENEKQFLIYKEGSGSLCGTCCLLKLQEGVYGISNLKIIDDSDYSQTFKSLVGDILEYVRSQNGKRIIHRVTEGDQAQEQINILTELSFEMLHRRVEYRLELDLLPNENGTPFQWSTPPDLSDESLRDVSKILSSAAMGDPDWDIDDNAFELLQGYLSESVLSTGLSCINIGSINGNIAAIVVAQVNPKTGWSRITYMGLLPDFRGRGLGKWVHRRGFEMMRAQGGRLYHGGTVATNKKMIGLFEGHGCKPYRAMQEWSKVWT